MNKFGGARKNSIDFVKQSATKTRALFNNETRLYEEVPEKLIEVTELKLIEEESENPVLYHDLPKAISHPPSQTLSIYSRN